MEALEIFPTTAWTEPTTLGTLVETFETLKEFYRRASQNNEVVAVRISI
jgi:hypothetical protein